MQQFYASKISPNLAETPERFLLARNVPIGRVGWMQYTPEELRINSSKPLVSVYRDPKDLFSKETIESFEGKDLTDGHPSMFSSPDNFNYVSKGHIQNVRPGNTYQDGDKLLADLLIKDATLISKVMNGVRETSSGYNFELRCYDCKKPINGEGELCQCEDPDRFQQVSIVGNHCAIVPAGRAGKEVAIRDELPRDLAKTSLGQEESRARGNEAATNSTGKVSHMKRTPGDWARHVFGLGLKTLAASDASPEEIAEAASSAKEAEKKESKDTEPGAVATNEKYDKEALNRTAERNSHDMKSKDEDTHPEGCRCSDCKDTKTMGSAKDIKAAVRDGMAEMMAELRAKKDGEKKEESKEKKAKDDMPDDEDMEGMDAWKKSMDAWKASTDSALSHIKDGLEELLKGGGTAKGGKEIEEEENKPAMDKKKGKDAEESNVPPTENETTPEEELSENKKVEDDDVDIIPALPKEDRPENPIPGADAALAVLRAQKTFFANPANFASTQAFDAARTAYNAQVRALKGKDAPTRFGTGPSYGDINATRKPEGLQGHDNAPKTLEQKGADYEEMMRKQGEEFRNRYKRSSTVG